MVKMTITQQAFSASAPVSDNAILRWLWTRSFVAYLKALSQHYHRDNEEYHENITNR